MSHLPKGYLSWSQFSLWEKSPQKWIDQYIYGKKPFETKWLQFGKTFSEIIFDEASIKDATLKELVGRLPKRKFPEAEIDITVEGVPLKIIFDTADENGFEEYKTGGTQWDVARAHNHGQMKFYTIGFTAYQKKTPVSALHWLPTAQSEDGRIYLTGEINSFPVSYTSEELDAFTKRIVEVADQISHWEDYQKKVIKI